MRTTRLRVTLREVTPAVVRVLDVPATATLPELHDLFQVAIGWTDSHLHQFVVGEALYGTPDEEWDDEQRDESEHVLTDLGDRFTYRYDFGDGWEHDVEMLGPGDDVSGVVGVSEHPLRVTDDVSGAPRVPRVDTGKTAED